MAAFKKLNSKSYQRTGTAATQDYIYWKQLKDPVLIKEFGPIDYVDFSPIEPHYFAVTCSVRVQVYNPITKLVVKNLSRFRENAYGATFRSDGRLLCTGGEEMNVKLFDVASKSLLRLFQGHTAAVHRTFFLHEQQRIASFSDDKSVKVWDIPTEKAIITYNQHEDYVRAGATSSVIPEIILSGGYDNVVKMYDTRTDKVVLSVDHGAPIESLLFLPSGGVFLSAGGTSIKIWDSLAGGKLLGCISQHHKTITCMHLASENKRLMSGSLDRHVKIYDLSTFQVVHTFDFPNGILSLGVSKNDDTLVAGLVDGVVSVHRREQDVKPAEKQKKNLYKYAANTQLSIDMVVSEVSAEKQARQDDFLRKFQYSRALDYVLKASMVNRHPERTVALIQELIRREALGKAFGGRDSESVLRIIRFFKKYLTDYRFTRVLITALHIFMDTYEDVVQQFDANVYQGFADLLSLVKQEIQVNSELASLRGTMLMLLAGASAGDEQRSIEINQPYNLTPSEDARRSLNQNSLVNFNGK